MKIHFDAQTVDTDAGALTLHFTVEKDVPADATVEETPVVETPVETSTDESAATEEAAS